MDCTLPIDFSNLLQDPIDYNVKIIVGEGQNIKEFKLHLAILSSRSIYFKNALSARWARKVDGIIIFHKPNISPLIFEILIKYIYTGKLYIENHNEISLVDVAIAADELQLLEVFQQLENSLIESKSSWQPKDIISVFQYDHFTNLNKIALKIVCNDPEIIFETNYFLKLEETHLIQLLKRDDLKIGEIKIWEYLIKWGIENTESILDNDLTKWTSTDLMNLEKTLHNCIPHVRFSQMSPDDYTKVNTFFKDILQDDLDGEVLQYFSNLNFRLTSNTLPPRYLFDSKIINSTDITLIASWIDKKKENSYQFNDIPFELKLIYRANYESFNIDDFHYKCDNKGPTVVIIKVLNSGEIIGGYNPLEWRSSKIVQDERSSLLYHNYDFYSDHKCEESNSFIFSLTNQINPILSRVISKKEAIIWSRNKGPCFGLKDLCIIDSFDEIIGKSIQHSYEKEIINRENFDLGEIEVFQIIDNRFFTFRLIDKIFKFIYRMFKFIKKMFFKFTNVVILIIFILLFISCILSTLSLFPLILFYTYYYGGVHGILIIFIVLMLLISWRLNFEVKQLDNYSNL
ncbi:hypothetical protein C1645_810344 [Glomus cerebriforme]|uniref:BTB/POZ domain-containing protein n=1 Tax=Glomus cerebriforme TaxID=658196 RepID=A0A397S9L6_9GLOM|nr:hypothetical protein C1645_810344 [Glomus cerebriforme]